MRNQSSINDIVNIGLTGIISIDVPEFRDY